MTYITHIKDNIYLSGSIDNYNELKNINMVINIRAEQHDDICELTKRNIAYFYIPVGDYGAPRMDQIKSFMELLSNNINKNILIHCAVGRGRSAMLIACYLVKLGMKPMESITHITKLRPEVSLTDEQMDKLIIYYKEIKRK